MSTRRSSGVAQKARIGGLRVKNIEAALQAEEQALTTVHIAVTKQLRRLEAEEQLLQEILRRTEQEEGQPAQAGQQPQAQPSQPPAQEEQEELEEEEDG